MTVGRGWRYGGAAAVALLAVAVGWGSGAWRALGRVLSHPRLPALALKELPFEYPTDLWREGIEGETVLRIHITEAGVVDSVELEVSSGHARLDSAAVAAAYRLVYRPATEGGRPIAVWALLPVRFQRAVDTVPAPADAP